MDHHQRVKSASNGNSQLAPSRNRHGYQSTPATDDITLEDRSNSSSSSSSPTKRKPLPVSPETQTNGAALPHSLTEPLRGQTAASTEPLRAKTFDQPGIAIPPISAHPPSAHSVSSPPNLSQDFNRGRQRIKLFLSAGSRFIVTALFIALFITVLKSYAGAWVFAKQGRNWFNAVVTGLSIGFGVHLASSMKSLAGTARWYFLARRLRSLEVVNLIMGCDSLTNVLKLVWVARNRQFPQAIMPNLIQISCVLWLFINLAFQVAVALLGLTYSLNNSQHLSLKKEPVSVPNLAVFEWGNSTNISNDDQQKYAAHSLGLIGSSMYFGSGQAADYLGPIADLSNSSARTIYENPGKGWTYQMVDSSTDGAITVVTNRTIDTSFDCKFYNVSLGDSGDSDIITVKDWPGVDAIYVGHASPGASNYLTQIDEDCGPRCTRVQAFQAEFHPTITSPGFFDCNITVSPVKGAYNPAHELSDSQAKLAAGAIGFGGPSNHSDDTAYQVYPNNAYGANSTQGNPIDMGMFLSSFAIQTIASVAAFIPRTTVTTGRADAPTSGFGLSVNWGQAIPILAVIPAVHFVLMLLLTTLASKVVVHDDSALGMARLLRGQVARMGEGGSLLEGGKLAREVGGRAVYGPLEPRKDVRSLAVGGEVVVPKPLRFPNGRYE